MQKPTSSPVLQWNDPKATRKLGSYAVPERRAELSERRGEVRSWLSERRQGVERALGSLLGL